MSSTISLTRASARDRRRQLWHLLRNQPLVWIGAAVLAFWLVGTLVGPSLLPYNPLTQNMNERLIAPGSLHWWGTDKLGRDIFARVIIGTRISLPAGMISVLIPLTVGTTVGALAGYLGGLWDELLMRITDVFFAFPTIILAMAIAAALGPSIVNAIIAVSIIGWPSYARMTRSLVISIKPSEYVDAARAIGAPGHWILLRTIMPNCVGPLIVLATIDLGNAILGFAGLSFLGLGPSPDTPEWGRMIADGIEYSDQWWISAFPGLAIFSVVMALNFIGDGLRDLLDPRTSRA